MSFGRQGLGVLIGFRDVHACQFQKQYHMGTSCVPEAREMFLLDIFKALSPLERAADVRHSTRLPWSSLTPVAMDLRSDP